MKIYEVKIEVLDAYRGNHVGYATIGYYARKERAEEIKAEAEANRNKIVEGEVKIVEIEVEE